LRIEGRVAHQFLRPCQAPLFFRVFVTTGPMLRKKVIDEVRTPTENYNIEIERLNELLAAGAINQDQFGRAVEKANERYTQGQNALKGLAGAGGEMGDALGDAVKNLETDFSNWKDVLTDLDKELANIILKRTAFEEFGNVVSSIWKDIMGGSGGGGGGLGGFIGSLFGGGGSDITWNGPRVGGVESGGGDGFRQGRAVGGGGGFRGGRSGHARNPRPLASYGRFRQEEQRCDGGERGGDRQSRECP